MGGEKFELITSRETDGYQGRGQALGAGVIFLASRQPHHAVRPALITSPAVCTNSKVPISIRQSTKSYSMFDKGLSPTRDRAE